MMKGIGCALLLSLVFGGNAFTHNLDEYLQAAVISLHPDEVHLSLRLVPGVAVLPELLKSMDTNSDGIISESEQRAYTARLLSDLSLRIDGAPVTLQVRSADFPAIDVMKEGLAEIHLEVWGTLPAASGKRSLVFENGHLCAISVYLANALVPSDEGLEVISQHRSESQSFYEVVYRHSAGPPHQSTID